MALFSVTYEIVTPESAEEGDAEERGSICEGFSLRDAMTLVHETRTSAVDGVECIECDSYPCDSPRWITVTNGMEYETGACESRSICIPPTVTRASSRRIARLMGAKVSES